MLSKKVLDSIDDTYSFYNKETGEDESVSEVIQKSLIEERKEIKTKAQLISTLEKNPYALNEKEILKIARNLSVPINSFADFAMFSMDRIENVKNLKPRTAMFLLHMLCNIQDGGIIDTIDNVYIDSFETLCKTTKNSRSVMFSIKKELDEMKILRMVDLGDSYIMLLNPTIFKRKYIHNRTFLAFKDELKEYNLVEYLYCLRRNSLDSSKVIKKRRKKSVDN